MKVIPREARKITYSTEIRNLKKRLTLSHLQKAVIVGSILGDGTLLPNWSKTNYKLRMRQSIKQKEYILWKYKIFKDWTLQKPKYQEVNDSLSFATVSHKEISELRKVFYGCGKKMIPKNISTFLKDPVTLAVWFMDDGNVIRRNGKVYGYHLNTQSFTRQENQNLSEALRRLYGIESLIEINHKKFRLRVMKKDSRERFKALVNDYILESMRYKIS